MRNVFSLTGVLILSSFFTLGAFAADLVEIPMTDLIAQVVTLVTQFGGMSFYAKVSGITVLLMASMQVSFLRPLWDKLGNAKVWVALALPVIAGVFKLDSITLAGVLAFLSAGVGAIAIRNILEGLKAIPGIGKIWVTVFDLIASFLGGKPTEELQAQKAAKLLVKK